MRDSLIELIDDFIFIHDRDVNHWYSEELDEKLADYLLANGVIMPPCKVGDIIYHLRPDHNNEWGIEEKEVLSVMVDKQGIKIYAATMELFWSMHFGKTVFLTKEDAEATLAERNKNN